MIAGYFKKGFISIFWIAVMMVVMTATMVTATYMFSTFASIPADLISRPFQDYYDAEFGISYGNYRLSTPDIAITGLVVGPSLSLLSGIVFNNGSLTVTITRRAPVTERHYTITSSILNSRGITRTITANWDENILSY